MRPIRRVSTDIPPGGKKLLALASALIIAACSLPEINIKKQQRLAIDSPVASFTSGGSNPSGLDKRYLATVHIRFSESKDVSPLSFDIRKDKKSMIAARLFQTEKTVTTLSLGYTGRTGPIVGCRFSWRF